MVFKRSTDRDGYIGINSGIRDSLLREEIERAYNKSLGRDMISESNLSNSENSKLQELLDKYGSIENIEKLLEEKSNQDIIKQHQSFLQTKPIKNNKLEKFEKIDTNELQESDEDVEIDIVDEITSDILKNKFIFNE